MSITLMRLLLALLGVCLAGTGSAAPHIPASGAQVVERLPGRAGPAQRELARMRTALAREPSNLALATALARRYIEQARSEGDPRYLGYAQAALRPWYARPQAPTAVLVLRATLHQSTHRFDAALADLDIVLGREPGNAQAWLTRATILTVTGRFAQARESCEQLESRAPPLVVQACLSSVGNQTGSAARSYAALAQALQSAPGAGADLHLWVLTLLGEMAARAGNAPAAERHFTQALALDANDSYLLGAYADFLLDQRRAPDAARLLRGHVRADALLLRYALALRASGNSEAPTHIAALRDRFNAGMMRADTVHQREQARFELKLRDDPGTAVRLALQNWAVQKEPADLRILLEAALASGDPEAARRALDWVRSSRIEDAALAPLVSQLRERS